MVEPLRPAEVEPAPISSYCFVKAARQAAYDCFARVARRNADDLARLLDDITARIRSWARPDDPPLVVIEVEDSEYLPWEWLAEPVPWTSSNVDPTIFATEVLTETPYISDAAEGVLGFAAMVCRIPVHVMGEKDTQGIHRYLATYDNRVRIKYIRHLALTGSSVQEGYFNSHAVNIDMVGPLPGASSLASFNFPQTVVNPTVGGASENKHYFDQIVHIHCHHDASPMNLDEPGDDYSNEAWSTSCIVLT